MPSLSEMAAARGRTIDNSAIASIKVQQIHYTKLHPSEMNFYGQNEIVEMADSIALAGIIQPLIVRKTDMGEYEVIVGHRRRLGAIMNVERGIKECEFLPCIEVKATDKMVQEIKNLSNLTDKEAEDIYVRYILIASNSINRELTDFERMEQAMELKVIIPYLRGNKELKGRALRTEIAKEMKRSTGQVGTYESIYNNLISEGLERFRNEEIGISVAAGLASLPKDIQKKLVSKQDLRLADIEKAKEILAGTVSESDTQEMIQTPIPTRIETDLEEQETEEYYEDVPAAVEEAEPELVEKTNICDYACHNAKTIEAPMLQVTRKEKQFKIFAMRKNSTDSQLTNDIDIAFRLAREMYDKYEDIQSISINVRTVVVNPNYRG